jgi:3'-phosphoadenosine 5'-phosphosulfate sulfotransferase (PAPS reductase)/FAD synthetase
VLGIARPINDYLRQFPVVISIEGICWHESPKRAQDPRCCVRKEINTCGRVAYTWNAIIEYSLEEVWATFGQSVASHQRAIAEYEQTGIVPDWWTFHPAYAMGNTRLSCSICILANKNDYLNGIKHNPEYATALSELEEQSGYTVRQGISIKTARALLNQGKI